MANPLLQMTMGNQAQSNQFVQMYRAMQNPQQLIQSNPQLQQILAMYNGDAKTAFYTMCKEKNIDPNTILQMFK